MQLFSCMQGVTSGTVGMQVTSAHIFLLSEPGGSDQRHSPALLHMVTWGLSVPGTLKALLGTIPLVPYTGSCEGLQ